MDILSNFWGVVWTFLTVFVFIAYLMVLFSIIGDLFRDTKLNGWWKALWIIFLIWVPFLTALVYLIARGPGMAERQQHMVKASRAEADAYIRDVAGTTPASQIATAKELLDSGAITAEEFAALKSKALA